MRKMRTLAVLVFLNLGITLNLAGCGQPACSSGDILPDEWHLTGDDGSISVDIKRSPYSFTVHDGSGRTVLSSLGNGQHDGYGAVGWTSGQTSWSAGVSEGYYSFAPLLDPWRDHADVVGISAGAPSGFAAVLASVGIGGQTSCMTVRHTITGSSLRVEASVALPAASPAPRAWSTAFASTPDEAFLGLGERYDHTNQRGQSPYSWPEEGGIAEGEGALSSSTNPYPNGESMTYYPVPFFLSTEGYGFWLDSTWRNQFELDSVRDDAWRAWHIGPTLAFEVFVPRQAPGAPDDSLVPAPPWPLQIIDEFTAETGRPMVPPSWSFGPRRRIGMGDQVGGVPEYLAMRQNHLPLTVIDDNTHFLPDGSEIGQEAALSAWVATLRQSGYRAVAYFNSLFSAKPNANNASDVAFGVANHYFLANAAGTPETVFLISGSAQSVYQLDFTSPTATSWYTAMFDRALSLGYSGWMYDFGEYVQPDMVTSTEISGEQYHNQYPVDYQHAAYQALSNDPLALDNEWFFYARSGYTGSQQWTPMVWSGDPDASFDDAEGVPAQVRAGINLGVSGVANWGSDISGFKCLADGSQAANGELLTRWIEFGAMCSNMHDENACSGGTGPKATLWTSPDGYAAWQTYAGLHTRMFPYLTALAQKAHTTGEPLMQHLFLRNPGRHDLASIDDAYYFGPSLLVAPVVARGATSRTLDLPPGLYFDWRDQLLYDGTAANGVPIAIAAPLAKLPLLLVDGQLLPLLDPSIQTVDDRLPKGSGTVGLADVAGVYDVVGLVSTSTAGAQFAFSDGTAVSTAWNGNFAPGALTSVDVPTLATCDGCFRTDPVAAAPTVTRVRVSSTADVTAGGLVLHNGTNRRLRWDLYLHQ